jgi:hypothetical protein
MEEVKLGNLISFAKGVRLRHTMSRKQKREDGNQQRLMTKHHVDFLQHHGLSNKGSE